MVKFSHKGVIHAPVEAVFAVLSDPSKIPQWRKDVPSVTKISGTAQKGMTFVEEVHFMGIKQLQMEVVEFKANQRLVIAGRSGMPMLPTQIFDLAPCAEGTELSLQVEMRVSGFWKVMSPLLPMMLKKIWREYFKALEALV